MGKYWLFAGEDHYPLGGFEDFVAASGDIGQLQEMADRSSDWDWWHIVDTETMTVVRKDS